MANIGFFKGAGGSSGLFKFDVEGVRRTTKPGSKSRFSHTFDGLRPALPAAGWRARVGRV